MKTDGDARPPAPVTDDRSVLTAEMAELVERAEVAVVATADASGECDSSLRTGPPGFIRRLDARHVAYPEYRGNGVMASLGNLDENPHLGLMIVDFAGDRTRLQLRGPARPVEDATLRAEHPDIPRETVPGRRTEVWVVLEVAEAEMTDGTDLPPLHPVGRERSWGTDDSSSKGGDYFGAAARDDTAGRDDTAEHPPPDDPPATPARAATAAPARDTAARDASASEGPAARTGTARTVRSAARATGAAARGHHGSDRGRGGPGGRDDIRDPARNDARDDRPSRGGARLPLVTMGLLALSAVLAVCLVVSLLTSGGSPPAAAAPPGPTGPATLYGRVVDVPDPAHVVVDVQGQPVTVSVLGVDPSGIPACAQEPAEQFAHRTLDRQLVTLVPDPTLAPSPEHRAYVVLAQQLSYTDALIRAGWAEPAGSALYRPTFDTERDAARKAGEGMYGSGCTG